MNNEKKISITAAGKGLILQSILFLFIVMFSYADNPIVSHVYTADPSGFVANGRMYVVVTHDQAGATDYSQLYDYYLFSSADLVNWEDHGIIWDSRRNTTWANLAYAPDMAYKNGKYYLYFPNGASSIGVAVSDSPEGPFVDAIGRPLVDRNTPNANVEWIFDPGIFVDDDGTGYLYFGGGGPGNARVIKLNDDMISVDGAAVTIDAPRFFEAAYMHKKDGIYYYSYSSDFSEGAATIEYMTSNNPMTGFVHRGTILPNPWENLGNNNHHSIVEYQGEWYIFYHNRAVSGSVYQRSVCLDKLYYNADGTIRQVVATREGVPAVNPGTPTPTPPPTPTPDPNANIVIRAMGTQPGGILEVLVNGSLVKSLTLATTMTDYYAKGSGGIELHFTNDDNTDSGLDLQVDYIKYNGVTFEAEDQEINTAVWQDDSCGGSYSEWMHCNGYIRFVTGDMEPTPTPIIGGPGSVTFGSKSYTVAPGAALNVDLFVNTGTQNFAAYGITLEYAAAYLSVDSTIGTNGVSAGAQGFVAAVKLDPGRMTISGFDAIGKGPGSKLHMNTIHFKGVSQGTSPLTFTIQDLADSTYETIGYPSGDTATVLVSDVTSLMGDVNGDKVVNIVDALMTAQYFVGLEVDPFNPSVGDVNCDGTINIVDSLVIAQYYVGLVDSLDC